MSDRWFVRGSGIVIALLATAVAAASDHIRFSSPEDGALLLGPTKFCVELTPGAIQADRVDVYVGGRMVGTALPPSWCVSWNAPAGNSGSDIVGVALAKDEVLDRARLSTFAPSFGEEVRVAAVQLYPVVVDRHGRFVAGLDRDNFAVFDQGRRVEIEVFAAEVTTLNIAILLDTSTSMFDRLVFVKEAACRFVDKLDPGDRIAASAFNHAIRHVTQPTLEREPMKAGIRALEVGGSTALYDSLIRSLEGTRSMAGRRAVLLFSDGKDERSLASLDDAIRAAHRVGAIVYTVGAGDVYSDLQSSYVLRRLAIETGGEAYLVDRLNRLGHVFDSVLSHLRSQYLLSYTPPAGPTGLRQVEVRTNRPGLEVRCRKSYVHGSDLRPGLRKGLRDAGP